jgi:hypothetical protein
MTGYYGKAAGAVREYADLLYNQMAKSNQKLIIYGTPVEEKETFLSDSLITVYNRIFDRAEKAVAESPDILEHVKIARLPLYYAMLEIARDEKTGKRGAFIEENNNLTAKPEIVKILYDFAYLAIKTKISHVREGSITPMQYLEDYARFLQEGPTAQNNQ